MPNLSARRCLLASQISLHWPWFISFWPPTFLFSISFCSIGVCIDIQDSNAYVFIWNLSCLVYTTPTFAQKQLLLASVWISSILNWISWSFCIGSNGKCMCIFLYLSTWIKVIDRGWFFLVTVKKASSKSKNKSPKYFLSLAHILTLWNSPSLLCYLEQI